jgi:hypothetical protein
MSAFEVIGAFVDRERVDPEMLKAALSTEEGREYLVDLIALREVTNSHVPAFEDPKTQRRARTSTWLGLVAAILLSVTGGYLVGQRQALSLIQPPRTVAIDRPAPVDVIPAAPAPTTIIKLEPGVDWKESAGG